MKTYIQLFTVLILLFVPYFSQSTIAATTESSRPEGDGSKENPFLISSAKELQWFRQWVNGDEDKSNTHVTACAKLTTDIDCTNIHLRPIGDGQNFVNYMGIFDGNYKTISNINLSSSMFGGLFSYASGATIKNLTINNASVSANYSGLGILAGAIEHCTISGIKIINSVVSGKSYIGAIAGRAENSRITNCEIFAKVNGEKYVGGLVGNFRKDNTIANVFSSCEVSFTSDGGLIGGYIGGVNDNTSATLKTIGLVAYDKETKFISNGTELQGDDVKVIGYGTFSVGFILGCNKETLKSGVVAYILQQKNNDVDVTWGQNLSIGNEDAYPILGSTYEVYANDNVKLTCNGELQSNGTFSNIKAEEENVLEIIHNGTSEYKEETIATCTENGMLKHYECSNCHCAYKDNNLQIEIFDITVPLIAHNYNSDDICTMCNSTIPIVHIGDNNIIINKVEPINDKIIGYNLFKFTPTTSGILEVPNNRYDIYSLWDSNKTKRLYFGFENKQTWFVTANSTYYIGIRYMHDDAKDSDYTLSIQLTETPSNLTGLGTANEPFILKNAEHLKFFADYVNGTYPVTATHYDACAKIADDVEVIDMSRGCHAAGNGYDTEVSWTPIGSSDLHWRGVFDGNGKTISNLYINGNQKQLGLFGYVYGSIKNLTISNATVINNTSQSETGILAGYAYDATIQNIVIDSKSSISAGECTGSIVGNANHTKFYNCINYAKVSGTNKVGGIAGATHSTYSTSSNYNCLLNNVFAYGDVTTTGGNAGGLIVGDLSKTTSNGVIAYNKDATLTINGTQVETKATGSGSLSSTAYTKDEVKSGKLTYALNNGVTDGSQIWYQKLGENGDEYPMMKSTGENTVYGAYHHGDKDRFFSNTVITNQHSVAYNVEAENEANGNHDVSYEAGDYAWTEVEDKALAPSVAVTYTCKVCGKKETPQMTVEHDAEHDNEAATCTEEGHNYYKTSYTFNDKAVFSDAYTLTLPALGHDMSDEVTFNDSKSIYQKGCTREDCGYHDYYATSDGSIQAKANDDESAFTVETFTLDDATVYDNKTKFTVTDLTYNRSFSHDKWLAVYVPFDFNCSQLPDEYEMATINNFHEFEQKNGENSIVLEVKLVKNGATIPALTPCLIRMKQAPETTETKSLHFSEASFTAAANKKIDCASVTRYYQFLGTLNAKTNFVENSDFVINEGELYPAGSDTQLYPQRWYLNASDREGNQFAPSTQLSRIAIHVIGGDETTGIDGIYVKTDTEDASSSRQGIYDLQGRKLSEEPASGIYIKDGKKYVK